MNNKIAVISLSTALLVPAIGNAAISSKELVHSCTSQEATEIRVCKIYLQGFVDGAITTDPEVAERVVDEAEKLGEEKFGGLMTRAIKTRISQKLERFGASYFADFCLPETDPEITIYEAIRQESGNDGSVDQPARQWVYAFLKNRFPCEK